MRRRRKRKLLYTGNLDTYDRAPIRKYGRTGNTSLTTDVSICYQIWICFTKSDQDHNAEEFMRVHQISEARLDLCEKCFKPFENIIVTLVRFFILLQIWITQTQKFYGFMFVNTIRILVISLPFESPLKALRTVPKSSKSEQYRILYKRFSYSKNIVYKRYNAVTLIK